MTKKDFTIGIDIGGTNTVLGFVDEYFNNLQITRFSTQEYKTFSKFILKLTEVIEDGYEQISSKYYLKGIAIAAPSANYFNGTIEGPANLNWGKVDLKSMLQQSFDRPISIMNDANAAALGEMISGVAKGIKNFVVITLGTGIGSGIIIDGKILYGAHSMAGELGHTTAVPGGRKCSCGKLGCLEAYASANGIRHTVIELMNAKSFDSVLCGIDFQKLTAKMISEAANNMDPLALDSFDYTAQILGRKLADVVACYDPEAIILSGGFMNAGELILDPTRKYFEANLLNIYKGKVHLLRSEMLSGEAAILGASMQLLNEIHDESKSIVRTLKKFKNFLTRR